MYTKGVIGLCSHPTCKCIYVTTVYTVKLIKYIEIEVECKDYAVSLSSNLSAARRYSHCNYFAVLYIHVNIV